MADISIVNYGMGNLDSIKRGCEECGAEVEIIDSPTQVLEADRLILPGVGSFRSAMGNITGRGLDDAIKEAVTEKQIPLLGICLGMQLLASKGYEGGESDGLDLIEGEVVKMTPSAKNERIPHIGWNNVDIVNQNDIMDGIYSGTDFYFVHSYHFQCKNNENVSTVTDYCGSVVSSVFKNNVFGVQFHPEKSQKPGFRLLKNFIEY